MTSSRDEQLPDTPAALLAFARGRRVEADRAEADLLQAAVQWAVTHPAESIHEAETIRLRSFGDSGIPVAGPGAPLVAEFSIAEFAAAIGLPTEAGKRYVGHAVELRYRLTRTWKRVLNGDLPAWRARRIADQTLHLSLEAAKYVDRHVAPVAHKVKPAQVDRLVDEAIGRFMPEAAEERRRQAADGRHFTVDHHGLSFTGTSTIYGELDLADALDLEQAVGTEAQRLADLGNTECLDARRATAVGNLARRDLVLDYPAESSDTPLDTPADTPANTPAEKRDAKSRSKSAKRTTVLHLHLSETAVRGTCTCGGGGAEVGRVENTRSPVTAESIREWCGRPDTNVVVKPVMDLAEHVSVEAYEVPERVAEPAVLRDVSCVFPWCTRPARRLRPDEHPCDQDHQVPYDAGGPTCSCQIAPLCRRHHRLKTHGGWRYYALEAGSYVWTSPHGYQYLRDHTGTLDISRDRHRCRPPTDDTPPTSPTGET